MMISESSIAKLFLDIPGATCYINFQYGSVQENVAI